MLRSLDKIEVGAGWLGLHRRVRAWQGSAHGWAPGRRPCGPNGHMRHAPLRAAPLPLPPPLGWGDIPSALSECAAPPPPPSPGQVAEPLLEFRAESAAGSVIAAIAFGAGVWGVLGADKGAEYFAGYLLEQSLSGEPAPGQWWAGLGACGRRGLPCCRAASRQRAEAWSRPRPPAPALRPVLCGAFQCILAALYLGCFPHKPPPVPPTPTAVDNLFVFILVFSYFKTPVPYQSKASAASPAVTLASLAAVALSLECAFLLARTPALA